MKPVDMLKDQPARIGERGGSERFTEIDLTDDVVSRIYIHHGHPVRVAHRREKDVPTIRRGSRIVRSPTRVDPFQDSPCSHR